MTRVYKDNKDYELAFEQRRRKAQPSAGVNTTIMRMYTCGMSYRKTSQQYSSTEYYLLLLPFFLMKLIGKDTRGKIQENFIKLVH